MFPIINMEYWVNMELITEDHFRGIKVLVS